MTTSRSALFAVSGAAALLLTGCGAAGDGAVGNGTGSSDDGPVAVATTTQLGSVLDQITQCTGSESETLMGPGDDPHSFSISSQQMAQLAGADLVIANGLGLEANLASALENAASDGVQILEVAPLVDPIPFGAHGEDQPAPGSEIHGDAHAGHDHAEDSADDHGSEAAGDADAGHDGHAGPGHSGHDHGEGDPHFWLDAERMAEASLVIGDELASVTGEDQFLECAQQVHDDLLGTDEEVTEILSSVPEENRILVTDHDSFGYFAAAYGFDIAGVVVPGGSTDAEPSSAQMAALVEMMREIGADTIFTGPATSSLVDAVAAESGGEIQVVQLEVGSLSEDTTYQDMMVSNAQQIAGALE